ncbi:MAG: sigma factor-like helix-turn-helix DNA-binding protein [Candidatus Caldarchaeum sp.]
MVARVAWEQALAGLSGADRQLVEWVWVVGVSRAEAARRLGVSQPAVAKRLARI